MISLTISFKTLFAGFKKLVADFKELLSLVTVCLFSLSLFASANNSPTSIFDLMNHQEVLRLSLESDFEKLKSDLRNEEYQPASLVFTDAEGIEQAWKMKVKLRGKFRRMNCSDIPPLKLKFKKSDLALAGLADFNDMKLVPQCVEDKAQAADYVMREYLAYRVFNEISPYSYRVQLLRITYVDSGTGKRSKQWAFLIEDTAQLKARLGATKVKNPYNLEEGRYHPQATRLVAVFQYLIGNPDWSLAKNRNVKLLEVNGKVVPVPYDFDFSGFVNTFYASAEASLGLDNCRDRIYLGLYEDTENIDAAIHVVVSNQEKIEKLIKDFKPLCYDSKLDLKNYLNSFFEHPEIMKMAGGEMAENTPLVGELEK